MILQMRHIFHQVKSRLRSYAFLTVLHRPTVGKVGDVWRQGGFIRKLLEQT